MTEDTVPAVRESDAEGKVKAVFEDIKSTLNSPTVGQLFRRLAVYPWYLELAWRNLKPNAAIYFFDKSASEIRRAASEAVAQSQTGTSRTGADPALLSTVSMFYDLDPKLLLVAGLLRAGTNGQVPKMNMISPEEKRILAARQPVSNRDFAELDSQIVDSKHEPNLAEVYADSRISPGQFEFSVLAASSTAFSGVWSTVKSAIASSDLDHAVAHLRTITIDATEAMPFRMEISATACRQSGLSEDQIDAVRRIINGVWVDLPRVILAIAAIHDAGGANQPAEQLTAAVAARS
jgi:hypothetical protein